MDLDLLTNYSILEGDERPSRKTHQKESSAPSIKSSPSPVVEIQQPSLLLPIWTSFEYERIDKEKEFQLNLNFLGNLSDMSYDDLRAIVYQISFLKSWFEDQVNLIPPWNQYQALFIKSTLFIRIMEDMKSFTSQPFPLTGDLSQDLKNMVELVASKKSFWNDFLLRGRIQWSGFPLDEGIWIKTKFWLFGLPQVCLDSCVAQFNDSLPLSTISMNLTCPRARSHHVSLFCWGVFFPFPFP